MSRSNQTELINPAQRFFSWKGGDGELVYFDKERGEKGENVIVPFPFRFLVLDVLTGATGGKEVNGQYYGYWSNAVRNTKHQQLVVKAKDGVVARGFYEDIKGRDGIKFQQLVYIAFYDDDKNLQIGCLKLHGAAVSAWFEYRKAHRNIYDGAITITGRSDEKKKGKTVYYEPVFAPFTNVSDETDASAKELDVHLQEYLTAYFAQTGIEEVEQAYTGDSTQFDESPNAEEKWAAPDDVDDPDADLSW